MKVAALQAPLTPPGSIATLPTLEASVRQCEARGIGVLCCPEGILGGLADYAAQPDAIAFDLTTDTLAHLLRPLASPSVTTIVGFTERDGSDLYNAAAIVHAGTIVGVYRKRHPAVRHSVYRAGTDLPVFTIPGLSFGVLICYDSTFREDARALATRGATVLFVPTNNALPPDRSSLVQEARQCDQARAQESGMWVVRADVVGAAGRLVSQGSSGITAPSGRLIASLRPLEVDILEATLPQGEQVERPNAG